MAVVQIKVSSHRSYDVICGQSVYLCLQSFWTNRTVDGTNRVLATLIAGPTTTSSATSCPPPPAQPCCTPATAPTWYTYCFTYDNDQLLVDPSTSEPYIIDGCVDVLSIILDICLVDSLAVSDEDFEFTVTGDTGTPETIDNGDVLSILGGQAASTRVAAVDTILVDVDISTDVGQILGLGMDGGLLVVGGGAGPVDCVATRACLTVDGFIDGDGSVGTPFIVEPSSDAGNIVTYGTDTQVFAPTDVLEVSPASPTAIGGTLLRHVASDGTIVSFPTGFDAVQQSASCGAIGVSASRSVRAVSLSGQTLIVDAAPEHSAGAVAGAFNGNPAQDISLVAPYLSGVSGLVIFNNPSACRIFRGVLDIYWSSNVALQIDGVWRYTGRLSVNGGPFNIITQTQWGVYPGLTGTVWLMVANIPFDVAAAGAVSFQWDHVIETLVPSTGVSTWTQFNSGIAYSGSTL